MRQDLDELWEGTLCQQIEERAALIQEASTQLERIEQDRVVKARVCAHHVTNMFTDFTHMCVCVPFSVITLASQLVCVLCLAFVG